MTEVSIARGRCLSDRAVIAFDPNDLGDKLTNDGQIELWVSKGKHHERSLYYLRKPAHVAMDDAVLARMPRDFFIVPLQNWQGDQWYDGPIVRFAHGRCVTWVSEGYPVLLGLPRIVELQNVVDETDRPDFPSALVSSLITALRKKGNPPAEAILPFDAFDLCSYVTWVLVKKAWPKLQVFPLHATDFKTWPSAAKRVCQNLGWSVYERSPSAGALELDVHSLRVAVKPWAAELAQALTRRSDVIPRSLVNEV